LLAQHAGARRSPSRSPCCLKLSLKTCHCSSLGAVALHALPPTGRAATREPPGAQALSRYADTAVPDSEKIEEPIEELRARFRLDAPFTYSVAVDVQPPVAWKQPYTGIQARRPRVPEVCDARHGL
jgi:hypothetical protein